MHDTTATRPDSPAPNPSADRPDPTRTGGKVALTCEDRLGLIHAFQAQALQRADPLAANLGLISGDLMLVAYRIKESMEADLTATPTSPERATQFARQAEMYLRFVRQLDRLARVDRDLSGASAPRPKTS